jgi:hypothetical protein
MSIYNVCYSQVSFAQENLFNFNEAKETHAIIHSGVPESF